MSTHLPRDPAAMWPAAAVRCAKVPAVPGWASHSQNGWSGPYCLRRSDLLVARMLERTPRSLRGNLSQCHEFQPPRSTRHQQVTDSPLLARSDRTPTEAPRLGFARGATNEQAGYRAGQTRMIEVILSANSAPSVALHAFSQQGEFRGFSTASDSGLFACR